MGRRAGHCILAVLVVALPLSCELSPSLLSDSERSSLYTIGLSVDGRAITDGSVVDAGSPITASVSRMSEAQDPASLDLSIERSDGSPVAALRLSAMASPSSAGTAVAAAGAATEGQRQVPRIDGSLPSLQLPSQMISGAYKLDALISSADGKALQRSSVVVFVGTGSPSLDSVLAYPPSAEPGSSFLLAAVVSLSAAPEGADPWISWSRGGAVFAQGPLSAGLDRVVWTAPRAEGAYALSVDVYPAAPPSSSGFAFRALARQDIKAMVRMPPGGSADEFSDSLRFYSLLRLSGNFEDSGTRMRSAQPTPFGVPQLDVYSGGFGYSFGPTAGLQLPGLLPPSEAGRLLPFVLLFRLAPNGNEGRFIRFASDDNSFSMDFGLHEGRPYAELQSNGRTQRSVAGSALPGGPTTLAALLTPVQDRLELLWIADGEKISAPPLPLPAIPQKGSAVIGGSGSLAAVYDDFGLISRASPPALYRFAQRRRWRSDLVVAEGFEDGELPQGSVGSGPISFSMQGLELSSSASVTVGAGIRVDRPLLVDAEFSGPAASAFLDIRGSDGASLGSLCGSGKLLDGRGGELGQVAFPSGHILFELSLNAGAFTVAAEGGGASYHLGGSGDPTLSLGLRNAGSSEPLYVRHILVRSARANPAQ